MDRALFWRHALGAAVVLVSLWVALLVAHYLLTEVTADHITHGHEYHASLEWARTAVENLQSEAWQIALAAWVFKHFLWKGTPESK